MRNLRVGQRVIVKSHDFHPLLIGTKATITGLDADSCDLDADIEPGVHLGAKRTQVIPTNEPDADVDPLSRRAYRDGKLTRRGWKDTGRAYMRLEGEGSNFDIEGWNAMNPHAKE